MYYETDFHQPLQPPTVTTGSSSLYRLLLSFFRFLRAKRKRSEEEKNFVSVLLASPSTHRGDAGVPPIPGLELEECVCGSGRAKVGGHPPMCCGEILRRCVKL